MTWTYFSYFILFGCINKNLIKPETLHETDLKLSALNKIEKRRKRSTNDWFVWYNTRTCGAVINLGSDTFGNPIFQKGLQN